MWVAGRSIDYHERNNWACLWATLSPTDELFCYREWYPDPTKNSTAQIAKRIAEKSGDERYIINMIDPRAKINQSNTGKSALEDLNDEFFELRRQGVGTGGYWETFDTKGLVGRDDIRRRLRNSLQVKQPFHNSVYDGDTQVLLPTIWILQSCPELAKSLRQWRYEEWGQRGGLRDRKEETAQKFSHFCTALEGLLKDKRFRPRRMSSIRQHKRPQYFKNRG